MAIQAGLRGQERRGGGTSRQRGVCSYRVEKLRPLAYFAVRLLAITDCKVHNGIFGSGGDILLIPGPGKDTTIAAWLPSIIERLHLSRSGIVSMMIVVISETQETIRLRTLLKR